MNREIELSNGQIAEFPDHFTDQQIKEILRKKFQKPQKQTFIDKLGNVAGDFNKFIENIPRNVATGVTESGRNIANTPHNLANLVGAGEYVPNLAPTDFDYAKAYGATEPASLSDKLIRGLAQYAPAIALPGAHIGRAGESISSIPKVGHFLSEAASQAIPQAAYGATQNTNPLIGAAEGGIGSLAGSVIGKGIESGINALRPSVRLRGNLSPEKLKQNLEITKDTETNLGDVIGSPFLKRLYKNILPHIIGSGTYKTMARNTSNIGNKGTKLINKFSGNLNPENWGEAIKSALNNSFKDVQKVKNEKFGKVNEYAREANVTTDRSRLRKAANDALHQIESDADLAKFTNPSDIKLIKDIATNEEKEINLVNKGKKAYEGNIDITGKPIKENLDPLTGQPLNLFETIKNEPVNLSKNIHPGEFSPITGKRVLNNKNYSLKNTDILRGKIGEMAHEAYVKGEKNKGDLYQRLKNALEEDVNHAIEHSGSEQLKNAHKNAMEYYKNEYAPYEDADIRKFIQKGGDPDLILSHFIKGGKNDRANLLKKISTAVRQQPNGTDNILASSYLSRAMDNKGNLNPIELSTLYHNLGQNQKNALFGKGKMHEEIKNYVDLVNKNKDEFNVMFNANNGQRNIDLLAKMGQLTASLAQGHGVVSFLAPLVALGASSKITTKILSNPKYREKLVDAMIKNKKFEIPKTKKSLQKGIAIESGLSGQDEEQKPLELEVIGKRFR